MEHLALVGAELERVRAAFSGTADELAAALRRLADVQLGTVAPPESDAAVAAGLADLRTALSWLQSTSEQCEVVLARHLPDETRTTATDTSPQSARADPAWTEGSTDAG